MCVIKADGYGHGALPLARFLDGKCEYYSVATLEEALSLRVDGVTKPVLVLGYTSPRQYEEALSADIMVTIYSYESAALLSNAALKYNSTARVHIKVDTGMNRIGFADTDESAREIAKVAGLPGIEIEGLYTHFARAEEADHSSTEEQYRRFESFLTKLEARGVTIPIKHACNSAGLAAFDAHYDMARLGISLYGLYPSEAIDRDAFPLQPAMAWKTRVVHLKTVKPETGISYGHIFKTARETHVATLPIGYADGYPRALSNRGRVIVRDRYAPIIGRICMDMCMVDVTDIPDIAIEDEVILIGESANCRVTMEEIGAMSASFNYETACRVGKRVPRVYFYHGKAVEEYHM